MSSLVVLGSGGAELTSAMGPPSLVLLVAIWVMAMLWYFVERPSYLWYQRGDLNLGAYGELGFFSTHQLFPIIVVNIGSLAIMVLRGSPF